MLKHEKGKGWIPVLANSENPKQLMGKPCPLNNRNLTSETIYSAETLVFCSPAGRNSERNMICFGGISKTGLCTKPVKSPWGTPPTNPVFTPKPCLVGGVVSRELPASCKPKNSKSPSSERGAQGGYAQGSHKASLSVGLSVYVSVCLHACMYVCTPTSPYTY